MDRETLLTLSQVVGAIVGALTLIGLLWQGALGLTRLYSMTVGRRRTAYKKLRKLTTDVHMSYFVSVLGAYSFKNSREGYVELIFVDTYFYVQAWVDKSGKVTLYSVTSRQKNFRPPIWNDAAAWVLFGNQKRKLRLGKFTFADVPSWNPSGVLGWVGARRYGYSEAYSFGNPGHYQTYLIGLNDAGAVFGDPKVLDGLPDWHVEIGSFSVEPLDEDTDFDDEPGSDEDIEAASAPFEDEESDPTAAYINRESVARFRRGARPNLYGVTSPHFRMAENAGSLSIGPNTDQVRLLP